MGRPAKVDGRRVLPGEERDGAVLRWLAAEVRLLRKLVDAKGVHSDQDVDRSAPFTNVQKSWLMEAIRPAFEVFGAHVDARMGLLEAKLLELSEPQPVETKESADAPCETCAVCDLSLEPSPPCSQPEPESSAEFASLTVHGRARRDGGKVGHTDRDNVLINKRISREPPGSLTAPRRRIAHAHDDGRSVPLRTPGGRRSEQAHCERLQPFGEFDQPLCDGWACIGPWSDAFGPCLPCRIIGDDGSSAACDALSDISSEAAASGT